MNSKQFHLEPEFPDEGFQNPTEILTDTLVAITEDATPLSVEAITLAGHMGRIQGKLDIELLAFEEVGGALAHNTAAMMPTDQDTYSQLSENLMLTKGFLEKVELFVEPWRSLFYRPYKAVLERTKLIVELPELALKNGRGRIAKYEYDAKAKAEAETLRLQKEQRDREEAQRLETAVKAEAFGLSEQAIQTILTAPSVTPTPVVTPTFSRPAGMRKVAENWAAELTDRDAAWKWARAQKEMPAHVVFDFPVMNREAKTHRGLLGQKFPGWRGVDKSLGGH